MKYQSRRRSRRTKALQVFDADLVCWVVWNEGLLDASSYNKLPDAFEEGESSLAPVEPVVRKKVVFKTDPITVEKKSEIHEEVEKDLDEEDRLW